MLLAVTCPFSTSLKTRVATTAPTPPTKSLLVFIAMALFAGREDHLAATVRLRTCRMVLVERQEQRRWLDFPFKKGTNIRMRIQASAHYDEDS